MCQKWSFRQKTDSHLLPQAVLILLVTIFFATHALGLDPEYLASFHADITVHKDASLTVCEDITYVNVSRPNRHGIVRDFPTHYFDEAGKHVRVAFEIKSIELNNRAVPFKTTSFEVGTRILIGDPHTIIGPGTYRYSIVYDTNRQVLLHQHTDELYWNVNGNWWVLPIRSVSATVHFPAGVDPNKVAIHAYTGTLGSPERAYQNTVNPDGSITITSTRPFAPREGLTISLAIPRGTIHYPTLWEQLGFFVSHHAGIMLMIIGFLSVLMLYLISWMWLSRSQRGLVIPLFHPIQDLAPSAHRYVLNMGFTNRELAADIVQLAVEGFLRIEQVTKNGSALYHLVKLIPENRGPTPLQKEVLDALFGAGAPHESTLVLATQARQQIATASELMSSRLRQALRKNFTFVYRYLVVGTVVTLLLGILAYALEPVGQLQWLVLLFFVLTLFLGPLTFFMHRIYTPDGCTLRDQIKGFLLYLKTAESERMQIVGTPPTMTPRLYEIYLPYAIALGAEKQWTAQFAPVFERLLREDAAYQPIWFVGHRYHLLGGAGFNPDLFVHDIVAFSRSLNIPTQTSPTHVTSGMGGGGFSGGGRGGGGGGSW